MVKEESKNEYIIIPITIKRGRMKHATFDDRHIYILKHLSSIPRKMLSVNENENISEFVLHDLCHKNCFNLKKAAYFIDNPDFDCLKGVAGFEECQAYTSGDIWEKPNDFSTYMKMAEFNQKVRSLQEPSFRRSQKATQEAVEHIGKKLNIENPLFLSLDLKHDNTGILVYQKVSDKDLYQEQDILNGITLLGFCPVF